jgi:hypothetical protein
MGATILGNPVTVTTGSTITTLPLVSPITIIGDGNNADSYWNLSTDTLVPEDLTYKVGLGAVADGTVADHFLLYDYAAREIKKMDGSLVALLAGATFTGTVRAPSYYENSVLLSNKYAPINTPTFIGIATTPILMLGDNEILSQILSTPNDILKYDAPGRPLGWYGVHDFYTGYSGNASTLAMRIKNGNVGINTATPTEKLHVVGNILATGNISAVTATHPIAKKTPATLGFVIPGANITIDTNGVISTSGGTGGETTWDDIAGTITNCTALMSYFSNYAPLAAPVFTTSFGFATSKWRIVESSNSMLLNFNSVTKATLANDGTITFVGDVVAYAV